MTSSMQSERKQLAWAMTRMAQLQGVSLDPLRLTSSVGALKPDNPPMVQLARLCYGIDAAAPKVLPVPDRAHLPLLCHTAQTGWGVVLDRDSNDLWLVVTSEGQFHLPDTTLTGVSAIVQLTAAQDVAGLAAGVGLTGYEVAPESFAKHVRKTLLSYRSELLEAGFATAFMGFLALATSLFSMQVYDRVIPTRSEYTLIVLGIGVLLSILVELSIKFARSNIMDYVIVGVDNRLSREIFQRLLQLRVDQLPPSVGSLAGQMRGYEQVRGFYTSTTLFTHHRCSAGNTFFADHRRHR